MSRTISRTPKAIKRFTLQFGLVCVPVNLHSVAKTDDLKFNQLHEKCGGRIKQQITCPTCDPDKAVDRSEIVKGFEYSKGQYVTLSDEELSSLNLPSNSVISIQQFINVADVDPIQYDSTYWLSPDEQGGKPYALLQQVMQDSTKAALATITIRKREQQCLIRAQNGALVIHTLFNDTDIAIQSPIPITISSEEHAMASQLVNAMTKVITPLAHADTYETAVRALIDQKMSGKPMVPSIDVPPPASMLDLAAMLRASMPVPNAD